MNFEIAFTPVYRPGTSLSVSVAGAVLSLNGDAVDLSALEDGDILPGEVADGLHPMLAYAPIERVGNTIHLTLAQPYGYTPAYEGPPITRHSGNVNLPFPAEGEPISGGATILVDGDTIIRGTDLAQAARASQIDAIKAECRRRILLVMSEDMQRNTLAAGQVAAMIHGSDPSNWPPELQARQEAAMAAWTEIERLRARSNAIEEMEPLPVAEAVIDDAIWAEG